MWNNYYEPNIYNWPAKNAETNTKKVIVGLQLENKLQLGSNPTQVEVTEYKAAILKAQNRLLSDLSEYNVSNIKRMTQLPAIGLTIDNKALEKLTSLDYITHITEDKKSSPVLLK